MDEELGAKTVAARVFCVYDIVDLANGGGDDKGHEEGRNVEAADPEPDVNGVEQGEDGKAVRDGVDDERLAGLGELVEHHAEQEEVDQRPDPERVRRRRHVGFLWSERVFRGTMS